MAAATFNTLAEETVSMTEDLALFGGAPVLKGPFKPYRSLGPEEAARVSEVVAGGVLSRFLGCWDEDFYGGPQVRMFEARWAERFGVRHAVSMNSATSGLIAAIGAVGIEPGDEVIVSPYTMSASATSIVVFNGIPVFADVDPLTFNLDPNDVARRITPRTKAIMVPNIFGHPADLDPLMALAEKHGLHVIEDNAQAPTAMYKGRYAGTIGHVGVFSLNYHKHIQTGEGGVCVTNDDRIAERLQLIRNHAESVVEDKGVTDLTNMIGFNFRLGEMEAAVGIEQLAKIDRLVGNRVAIAEKLSEALSGIDGLALPAVKPDCTHVYYIYPILLDVVKAGVSRDRFIEALCAEGVPALGSGYVRPLYLLPMYQKRIAYGSKGYPFICASAADSPDYRRGACPVCEDMHFSRLISFEICVHDFSDEDVVGIGRAFEKVWKNRRFLV